MLETVESEGRLRRPDGEEVAWKRLDGAGPALVWLNGYRSDMMGTKAQVLADWARAEGRALVRFDYLGHGASSGDFIAKGCISRWRDDALAVIDAMTAGPVVLIGSSMGGWIASLVALARPERVAGLLLIAPAADFTGKLVEPGLHAADRAALEADGVYYKASPYFDEGSPFTRLLLEDGARWTILPGPIPIRCPVRILQGGEDEDVPWTHALTLHQAIAAADSVFTLIKDGDHRLSRPQDLERLTTTVAELLRQV